MKILITGSNGFVGSHIAEDLSRKGHHVICLVRHTSNLKWLESLKIEKRVGDVTQPHTLCEAVKGVDAVIHSAGVLRALDKEFYYHVNRDGTKNLAEALLKHNPVLKKLIYISSQAAMGPSFEFRPKRMDEPLNPVSDYGKSKLAGEKELAVLNGKVPYTILRPSSVYGPRDKDIFIFFQLVAKGLRPFTFAKRFFQLVYVKDISEAAIRAIENPAADYRTYFLADSAPYSWEQAAQTIAGTAGRSTFPVYIPDIVFKTAALCAEAAARVQGKPAVLNMQKIEEFLQSYWLADPSQAEKELGMGFTKFEIGAKITYSWYKENKWL